MAESSLSVKIGADVVDLQSKLAIANSNLRASSSEMRKLADQMRVAGQAGSSELMPGLQSAAAAAAKAKAAVAALNEQMAATGAVASSFKERISLAGKGLDSLRLRIADYTSLASKFGELLLIGFAGERILEGINRTAEMGEALLKLSEATGVSTQTLSGWHYAAGQLGIDTATLDTSLVRLAKSIQQALMSPTSAAAQSFQKMGMSQEFLRVNSNDLQAILLKMADAIHSSAAGGQQLGAVLNVMGKGAADMVPFLRQGSDGIAALVDRNRQLG